MVHGAQGGEHPGTGWGHYVTISKAHPLHSWAAASGVLPHSNSLQWHYSQTDRSHHHPQMLESWQQEMYGEIQGYSLFGQSGSGVVQRAWGPEPRCAEQQ